jgi:hypothetical protein
MAIKMKMKSIIEGNIRPITIGIIKTPKIG